MSATAKIAYVYWLHYAYTLDEDWLRTNGYPVIKGAAEFYRNFPNLYRARDGKYHIRYVNNHERDLGTSDTPEELTAMHEIFPLAIRASEILGVDANLRPLWKKVLDRLAPIPTALEPAEYYDQCNIGTENLALRTNVINAFHLRYTNGISEMTNGSTLSRLPVAVCNLGWTDKAKPMLAALAEPYKTVKQLDYATKGEWDVGVMRNRLALDEGPGAIECERLGMLSQALHLALLQSAPPTPDKEPINYLFPAWPKDWDAQFTLAARDAFVISASQQNGQLQFVEIHSRKGGLCRVHNPWGEARVSLYRTGKSAETISGPLLVIPTTAGETLTLVPQGQPLPEKMIIE